MIIGHDASRPIDAVFVNSPLKDYEKSPRRNDFTLPVLGLGYIATYAKKAGFNVGVLDAEANGLGITQIAQLINNASPRWAGLNLLAPTYRNSVAILQRLSSEIRIMLGGHQAKAMPREILSDPLLPRVDAMVIGEGESRVEQILGDINLRASLPNVFWRSSPVDICEGVGPNENKAYYLAPDINKMPFVDRTFLANDPFMAPDGRMEANLVGSRGCPYDCSFCGAAKSANPDISIRTRSPANILAEMEELSNRWGVTAFRFVDDLFLAQPNFMKKCLPEFIRAGVADKWVWDATGRINVLAKADEWLLALIQEAGCREVALGIESGSKRMLEYIDKHITPEMTVEAVGALTARGINVKGYFILGFPGETDSEMKATIELVHQLWNSTENTPGHFRCSVFEFRPYPGTPEWQRLMATGRYTTDQLLNYEHIDLTEEGKNSFLLERDEFNFSVNIRFGEVPVSRIREEVARLMETQKRQVSQVH
jgi:anaerobic magnesium-protoporphyrin IX monomethyl ester cyclase